MKSRLLLSIFFYLVLMDTDAQSGQSNIDRNTRVLQAIELALRDPNTPPLRKRRLLAMANIIEQSKGQNPEALFDKAMADAVKRFPGVPDREFFDNLKPPQLADPVAPSPSGNNTDTKAKASTDTTMAGIFGNNYDVPGAAQELPGTPPVIGFGKWITNGCPDHDDPGPVNPGSVQKSPTNNAAAKKTAENEELNRKAMIYLERRKLLLDDLDRRKMGGGETKETRDMRKAIDIMKKYIQDHLKDDPRTVLDNAALEAEKALATGDKAKDAESSSMVDQLYGLIKSLFDYVIKITNIIAKAMGTGLTTGNIADIFVTNGNDYSITIIPQTFYIPSDGQYQSYVGRIEDCITVPPNGTAVVLVTGFCTDVHSPPVPADTSMTPIEDWIPVGGPFDSVPPGTFPQVLEDMNPTASPGPSSDGYQVVLVTNDPQTSFTPDAIPDIIASTGYKPAPPNPDDDIIVTWPGTDIPIGGTFDPRLDPYSFASWIVDVVERVEDAAEVIQDSGNFPTPFSRDTAKEIETYAQQVIWEYTAAMTGDDYEKEDFAENVYDQFEDKTGVVVSSLPEERKDELDTGIDDFWNAFQAVGVEAKVISVESPGLSESVLTQVSLSNQSLSDNSLAVPDVEIKIPDVMLTEMPDYDKIRFEFGIPPLDTTRVDTTGCKDHDVILRLIEVKGDTNNIIVTLPDGTEVKAKSGMVIPENTTVTTGEEEELLFELIICKENRGLRNSNTYSKHKVGPNTEVKFDALQLQGNKNVVCKVQIKTGEIRIKVTDDRQDYHTDMKVATPNQVASVTGTDFLVRTGTAGDEILVNEGSVEVECNGHNEVFRVDAGKKIVIKLE